jgi:hypothetical protein
MFKNVVRIFVEKIYKMGFLEGSGVPILEKRTHGSKKLKLNFHTLKMGVFK